MRNGARIVASEKRSDGIGTRGLALVRLVMEDDGGRLQESDISFG